MVRSDWGFRAVDGILSDSERTNVLVGVGGVNLMEWARAQGVHPQTAYRWFREGTLPVPVVRVNERTVLVSPDALMAESAPWVFGLYARVVRHERGEESYVGRSS
jgi:hypothetical protein